MAAPISDTATVPVPVRRRRRARAPLANCLNCGAPVVGRYCPDCGQETHDQSVALGLLTGELLSEIASFDSKLMRTVMPLLFRPGFLTNEFNAGRRVRYLSPLRMYLVISALFFVVLSLIPDAVYLSSASLTTPPKSHQAKVHFGMAPSDDEDLPGTVAAYTASQKALPPARRDGAAKQYLMTHIIRARQSPKSVLAGFVSDLPRMMFVLLPAFAGLLKISYWRTKRLYVEHLIFALHMHAFVFLMLTVALLLWHRVSQGALAGTMTLLCGAYLLTAQKRVYAQTWGRTLIAFGWLSFNYFTLLTFAFVLTLAVAFLVS